MSVLLPRRLVGTLQMGGMFEGRPLCWLNRNIGVQFVLAGRARSADVLPAA